MINLERVPIEDCLDNYKYKNKVVVINDGRIIEIKTEYENSIASTDQS